MIVLNSIRIRWIKTLFELIIRINKIANEKINELCLKFIKKISNSLRYTWMFYQNIYF